MGSRGPELHTTVVTVQTTVAHDVTVQDGRTLLGLNSISVVLK